MYFTKGEVIRSQPKSHNSKEEIRSFHMIKALRPGKGCVHPQHSVTEKIAVLALVPEKLTQTYICQSFSCTRYQVQQSRKVQSLIICAEKLQRKRLDITKASHFLQYLFTLGAIQDVAYDTNLKFEGGDKLRIPQVVTTVMKSHAIALYKQHCSFNGYVPLSDTVLFHIMKDLKVKRMNLSGIDSVVVDRLTN